MAEGKSASQGGFALETDDDPFNTDVKVTLTGLKTTKQDGGSKEDADEDDDKSSLSDLRSGGDVDEEDDTRGKKKSTSGTEEDDGLDANDGDDDGVEDQEAGKPDGRLRAARRNAKRLKRALTRQGGFITQLQAELAETQGMVLGLVKGNVTERLQGEKSRLEQLRAARLQAREKEDVRAETEIEDEIGRVTSRIGGLEAQARDIEKVKQPAPGNAMLADWMDDNVGWYQKPGFEMETAQAQRVSQDLARQGIGRGDPRHFQEIDRQMSPLLRKNKRFKGEDFDDVDTEAQDRDDEDKETQRSKRGGSRVAGGGQRRPAGGGGGRGPQVPKALVDTFRAGGFDVNDPKVQKKMFDRYNETKSSHNL